MSIGRGSKQANRQNCESTYRLCIPGHSNFPSLQLKRGALDRKRSLGRRWLPTAVTEAVAVIARPRFIVSRISMGIVMGIPKGPMIGTMLATTVKTLLMCTFMRIRQLVVEPVVRVIAVVLIVVSQSGHHGHAQHHGGR